MKAQRKDGRHKSSKRQFQPHSGKIGDERSPGIAITTTGFFAIFGVALFAAWLAFLPSLSGSFIFDDFGLPFAKVHADTMPAAFWIGGVRPVLMASYWLNFILSGQSPPPYHFVNLCLHALAATFVYLCGLSLLKTAGIAESRQRILAVFVAGIFLLHPLQTESVDYIAGRSEVLTGVFYFAAFAVFLQALRSEFAIGRVFAVLALFGAAVLTKEHAVSLPALLLFTGVYWSDSATQHLRRCARLYVALAAVACVAIAIVLSTLAHAPSAGFGMTDPGWYEYFLTECRVLPIYLRLFIVPAGQNADWSFPFDHGLFDHGAAFYMLGLSIAVALAIRYRRRAPLPCYGFLVFLLLLAPTSSIVPIKDALAERRMYLPMFGLALAAAGLLDSLKLTGRNLATLVIAVLILAGVLSYRRSGIWTSEVALWRDVVSRSPSNIRGYSALAAALVKANQCAEAAKDYEKAIILAKSQIANSQTSSRFDLQLPLAGAYACSHQRSKARATLQGIASPEAATMFDELGVASAKEGDGPQALSDFNNAIRIAPNYADAYAHRGLYQLAAGDHQAADEDFGHALNLDPDNKAAQDGRRQLRFAR